MIEVAIGFAGITGDGEIRYLIDIPTEGCIGRNYFDASPVSSAIRRALSEFEKDRSKDRITQVRIRTTPDKVLQP